MLRQFADNKEFTDLYDLYAPSIYNYVYRLLKSKSLTEDMVQEVFVRAWMHKDILDSERNIKSYLFSIAHNLTISEFRKQINRPEMEEYLQYTHDRIDKDHATYNSLMDFDMFLKCLNEAKSKLTPSQRKIFEMNKEEGFSPAKIAEQLDIAPQTVRNQLAAALKILRKELRDFAPLFLFFCCTFAG